MKIDKYPRQAIEVRSKDKSKQEKGDWLGLGQEGILDKGDGLLGKKDSGKHQTEASTKALRRDEWWYYFWTISLWQGKKG